MDVGDVLGLDSLLALVILAFGLAMLLGNGYAIYQHRLGRKPKGATGEFRAARAYWLLTVGALLTVWGAASVFV